MTSSEFGIDIHTPKRRNPKPNSFSVNSSDAAETEGDMRGSGTKVRKKEKELEVRRREVVMKLHNCSLSLRV